MRHKALIDRLRGALRTALRERYDMRGYRRLPYCVTAMALLLALPFAVGLWRDAAHLADVSRAVTDATRERTQRDEANRARQATGATASVPSDAVMLLAHLEDAWRDDIGLRGIDVDVAARRARLQLSTASVDCLLAFVERLERTHAQVVLERHASTDDRAVGWALDASLEATW